MSTPTAETFPPFLATPVMSILDSNATVPLSNGRLPPYTLRVMPLDNPIWHSLTTRHAGRAIVSGCARRYPPETAPFVAVPSLGPDAEKDIGTLVQSGESIGILGVIPALPWETAKELTLRQYVWQNADSPSADSQAVKLGEAHVQAMLDLTALVYPAYFRPDTARLGDYYGLFEGGRLASMAGIRMAMPGFQELSAICTHPDFRGRGLAGRLTWHLVHQVLEQGEMPFLHTESDNPAQAMYEKLGFRLHQMIPFKVFKRP